MARQLTYRMSEFSHPNSLSVDTDWVDQRNYKS